MGKGEKEGGGSHTVTSFCGVGYVKMGVWSFEKQRLVARENSLGGPGTSTCASSRGALSPRLLPLFLEWEMYRYR